MTPIAFMDLKTQAKRIKSQVSARIEAVLEHGAYINGPEIGELEAALTRLTGAGATVACSSGTDALVIPLLAYGVQPRDAVFVPAFTYNATANAVLLAGGVPVFVDVDPNTFNMDAGHLADQIAGVTRAGKLKPKGIIAVDIFGLPADYDAIGAVAARHDLFVIADGAQSLGGKRLGKAVGALAPVTATSFFPSKTLGGYGDGGAIFVQDPAFAGVMQSIRWHGTDDARKESIRVGMNGRLDSIQAAVLLVKLSIFEEEIARRNAIAAQYEAGLRGLAGLQDIPVGYQSARALFVALLPKRDRAQAALKEKGIPSVVYYAKQLHLHDAFKAYGAGPGSLPVGEELGTRLLALPFHPYMSDEQVAVVVDAVRAAI